LELRTANSGRLLFLSDSFREGGEVKENDLLFKIDPRESEDAVEVSKVNLLETKTELAEARDALNLVEEDLSSARQQLALREQALFRKRELESNEIVTAAAVEDAQLLLSNAKQTLNSRETSLFQAKARIARGLISVTRAEISLKKSKRQLMDNEYRAPFSGIISKVSVVPGRLLNKNEQLGLLIDPSAIEVAFQVSNSEFSRIVDKNGKIISLPIKIKMDLNLDSVFLDGNIQRAGAEVSEGTSGRKVFATIGERKKKNIRPGDFLTVEIAEPELSKISIVPANSVDANGKILLVTEDNRLEEYLAKIIGRQGDMVILKDIPFGRVYVSEKSPQLSAGVKIKPIIMNDKKILELNLLGENNSADTRLELTSDRREKLIQFVNTNDRLPKKIKEKIISQLKESKVPFKLVSRLEKQIEGN
jgi:multidrug efflux pump subunit AcrA (membrane-fusion protein)